MLILNAQELESQGIPYRTATKILLQERLFVKGQSFSQRVKQVAIDLYEESLKAGVHCLLVESTEQLTLWRELKVADSISTASAIAGAVDLTAYARSLRQHQAIEATPLELQAPAVEKTSDLVQPIAPQTPQNRSAQTEPAMQTPAVQIRYRGAVVKFSQPANSDSANPAPTPLQPGRRTYRGNSY